MEVGMFFKLESPKLQTLSIFGHGEKAGRVLGLGGICQHISCSPSGINVEMLSEVN